MKFSIILCVKKLEDFIHPIKSLATLYASLGANQSPPAGFIDAADCCGRTPLVANSKADFFILICETNIIPVFLQIMVSRQKNIFSTVSDEKN